MDPHPSGKRGGDPVSRVVCQKVHPERAISTSTGSVVLEVHCIAGSLAGNICWTDHRVEDAANQRCGIVCHLARDRAGSTWIAVFVQKSQIGARRTVTAAPGRVVRAVKPEGNPVAWGQVKDAVLCTTGWCSWCCSEGRRVAVGVGHTVRRPDREGILLVVGQPRDGIPRRTLCRCLPGAPVGDGCARVVVNPVGYRR